MIEEEEEGSIPWEDLVLHSDTQWHPGKDAGLYPCRRVVNRDMQGEWVCRKIIWVTVGGEGEAEAHCSSRFDEPKTKRELEDIVHAQREQLIKAEAERKIKEAAERQRQQAAAFGGGLCMQLNSLTSLSLIKESCHRRVVVAQCPWWPRAWLAMPIHEPIQLLCRWWWWTTCKVNVCFNVVWDDDGERAAAIPTIALSLRRRNDEVCLPHDVTNHADDVAWSTIWHDARWTICGNHGTHTLDGNQQIPPREMRGHFHWNQRAPKLNVSVVVARRQHMRR